MVAQLNTQNMLGPSTFSGTTGTLKATQLVRAVANAWPGWSEASTNKEII